MRSYSLVLIVVAVALTGCTSTQKRAGIVGAGTLAGAGAGYAIGGKDNRVLGTAIGAGVGALGTALALGDDKETYQRGVDDGYVLGDSDSVKRLYWSKQALEQKKAGTGDGVMRYYIWEEEGTTPDGRKLAPEKVAVPIYEPVRTQ